VEVINAWKAGGGAALDASMLSLVQSGLTHTSSGSGSGEGRHSMGQEKGTPPAGGVVSTYRRPPTSSPAPAAVPSSGAVIVNGAGMSAGPVAGAGQPAGQRIVTGSYRPLMQPPRNKNSSAATLEVQMGNALHPPQHHHQQPPPPPKK
jgi:hypothetical protein